MKTKHLYTNFLSDKRVYGLARAYWGRIFSGMGIAAASPYNDFFVNGAPFADGNPIAAAYVPALGKSARIVQEAPETDRPEIGAWLEAKEFAGLPVNELVVSLELGRESAGMAKEMLQGWFVDGWDIEKMRCEIDRIVGAGGRCTAKA